MGKLHPDRHTLKPSYEREEMTRRATDVTSAYESLSDEHSRALHILELCGSPIEDTASGNLVGNEILILVMETREQVDSASTEHDLKTLLQQNQTRKNETIHDLQRAFCVNDLFTAKRLTATLQYWNKIEESIKEKIL